jgi:two-component system osmolarity sensor histidine kinase EnvZ
MLRSLLARNIALMAIIVLVSQAMTIVLFALFILRPQADRIASIMAHNISAVSTTIAVLDPPQRAALIDRINREGVMHVQPGSAPPVGTGGRASLLERVVLRALARELGMRDAVFWRGGGAMPLWVRLKLGGEFYWVSVDTPAGFAPNGTLIFSVLTGLVLALIAGTMLQRRINRPLIRLAKAVDAMPAPHAIDGLGVGAPSEVATLARSFEAMAQRLAVEEADRTLMLAGISHDLKTPLAKIRLALALRGGASEDEVMIERQLDRMDQMLDQFLAFGRGRDAEAVATVALAAAVARAIEAAATNATLVVVVPGSLAVAVRPLAFERVIVNLLRNAELHGSPPIDVRVSARGGFAVVVITDHGPGVPAAMLESLAAPFFRLNQARPSDGGVGLGLAIAHRFATDHGGALTLANRAQGGFVASLALPVA